jgi:hypothetical protein
LGRAFTFCLGQAAVNCRAMPRSSAHLVSWKVWRVSHSECRREAGKRAAEPPRSLATTTLAQHWAKKKPRKVRAGQVHMGTTDRGTMGREPPSKDTKPRDCPKFRPPASRAALSKSYSSTATASGLLEAFAYLLVERRGFDQIDTSGKSARSRASR